MINKRLKSCPKTFQISRSGEISPNMVTLKVTFVVISRSKQVSNALLRSTSQSAIWSAPVNANADILFFKSDKNRYILSELFLHGADLYKS